MINKEDLEISINSQCRPCGGMYTGEEIRAVKVEHKPTGISVISTRERSQHLNRSKCLEWLELILKSIGS